MPRRLSSQGDCSQTAFKALMGTQFFGALNDNLFKLFVSLIVVNSMLAAGSGVLQLVFVNVFFVSPYILFSCYAGFLADRFHKSIVIRATKFLELLVMLTGFYFLQLNYVPGLLVVLFLMGFQSALLSPSKYGILPEMLAERHLSRGNGYLEFWTYVAILAGTALGGILMELGGSSKLLPGMTIVLVALLGLWFSTNVADTGVSNAEAPFLEIPFAYSPT